MDPVKFFKIKKEYDSFYNNLLKSGLLPMKDTNIGYWSAAITEDVYRIFQRIGLERFRNILDIGSGDGKVVLIASLFTNAIGIEADPTLHWKAIEVKKRLGLGKARLVNDDFFKHNFSNYDVLFLNPDRPLYRGLEDKLIRELRGKLILYGPNFHPTRLKKESQFFVNNTMVTVYSNKRA